MPFYQKREKKRIVSNVILRQLVTKFLFIIASQSYLRAVQACTLKILIIVEVVFQSIETFMYIRSFYYLCYTIIIFRKMFEDNVICIYICTHISNVYTTIFSSVFNHVNYYVTIKFFNISFHFIIISFHLIS